jgi:type I restriction enzyme, S subunit
MSIWPIVTLAEVAILSSGGTPSKSRAEFWNGDIPWVSPKDMKFRHIEDAEDRVTRHAIASSAAKIVGQNSVLAVVRSGILAHTFPVATVGREVAFNQDIKAITPKNGDLLPAYLFWLLRSREPEILRVGVKRGATVHSLANGFLDNIRFPLPPLEEQHRIVELLDRSSDIRRRAEAARAKARAIIPALFLNNFGDPAANPHGWPVRQLSVLADIASGLTKGRKLNGQPVVSVPYLRVANVQDGHLDLTEIKTIHATPAEQKKNALLYGDLLMTEGGDPDKLGRCALWLDEIPGCLHQNHIFRVRLGRELLPEYGAAFIQSDAGKAYFLRVAKRTTGIASINKTQLGALPMMIPPIERQAAYRDRVRQIEALARRLDAAAAKAEAMAAALSAEAFDAAFREAREKLLSRREAAD